MIDFPDDRNSNSDKLKSQKFMLKNSLYDLDSYAQQETTHPSHKLSTKPYEILYLTKSKGISLPKA